MISSVTGTWRLNELRNSGQVVRAGSVRMRYLSPENDRQFDPAADEPEHFLAYALSRRFGNAVERNRARRRLRDGFATAAGFRGEFQVDVPAPGGSYLLTGSRSLLVDDFSKVVANIEACFKKLALNNDTTAETKP